MESLFNELVEIQQQKRLPPVTQWQPASRGVIDITIGADGVWLHEGEPIRRAPMVALFATILRLDDEGYALVTPAERLAIVVEDKPFLAVDMQIRQGSSAVDSQLLFTTNVGDHVVADAEHPLVNLDSPPQGGPNVPCIHVRDGLQARLSRPLYYRLVDHALQYSDTPATQDGHKSGQLDGAAPPSDRLFVSSAGAHFDLGSLV